ncbi:MAG: hypothetical protein R2852_07200 [Bacteroidia bacterium]
MSENFPLNGRVNKANVATGIIIQLYSLPPIVPKQILEDLVIPL